MQTSRWLLWVEKARQLREKYEASESVIKSLLEEKRPGFFRNYDEMGSLALLCILFQLKENQRMLYQRFASGIDTFSSGLGDEDKPTARQIKREAVIFLKDIESQLHLLREITRDTPKVSASDCFDRKGVLSIVQKIAPGLKLTGQTRKIHKKVLDSERDSNYALSKMRRNAQLLKVRATSLYYGGDLALVRNSASLIYLGSYIAYFLGVMSYEVFSPLTSASGELAKSNS